jgi:NADH-quinone oxidoreductase subunit E
MNDSSFTMSPEWEAELDELAARYPQKRSASLMFLHAIQERFGCVSPAAMEWTAKKLGLEPIHIYELVTFYPMFRQEKLGKYQIKVCRTLSCALGGSAELRAHLCRKLGLNEAEHGPQTTKDGKYTVEYVECLASCGTAPVMMVNENFYEGVTPQKADEICAKCP